MQGQDDEEIRDRRIVNPNAREARFPSARPKTFKTSHHDRMWCPPLKGVGALDCAADMSFE